VATPEPRVVEFAERRIFRNAVSLRRSDLEAILRFVSEANELATDENPLPEETHARFAEIVACDAIGVFEVDRVRRRNLPLDGPQDDRWWEIAHQHPICHYVEETGDFRALKLSDFLTRAELHRLELYNEYLRPDGVEDDLMLPLPSPPWHERGFHFYRSRRNFSERDREVLDAVSPHLARLLRISETCRRLEAALAALDAGAHDQGVVLLDSAGHLDHATPLARSLLAKYFPGAGTSLPETVADWFACSRDSLVHARGARRLVIDRVGQQLLVREEPARAAKVVLLTPREQQVLEWVAEGKTNAEIAQILVAAPATVRKHLEHIYAKLGVHTRTAAVAYARPRLAAVA
jgi:DNA-binding CsgD family transcriptional regulator